MAVWDFEQVHPVKFSGESDRVVASLAKPGLISFGAVGRTFRRTCKAGHYGHPDYLRRSVAVHGTPGVHIHLKCDLFRVCITRKRTCTWWDIQLDNQLDICVKHAAGAKQIQADVNP